MKRRGKGRCTYGNGTTGALELLDASYAKTTDNTDPRNISPQRGKVYHERDSDTETGYGYGGS